MIMENMATQNAILNEGLSMRTGDCRVRHISSLTVQSLGEYSGPWTVSTDRGARSIEQYCLTKTYRSSRLANQQITRSTDYFPAKK